MCDGSKADNRWKMEETEREAKSNSKDLKTANENSAFSFLFLEK